MFGLLDWEMRAQLEGFIEESRTGHRGSEIEGLCMLVWPYLRLMRHELTSAILLLGWFWGLVLFSVMLAGKLDYRRTNEARKKFG